jgi:hypothetical protein
MEAVRTIHVLARGGGLSRDPSRVHGVVVCIDGDGMRQRVWVDHQ